MKPRLNLRLAVGLTVVLALAAFGIASALADVSPTNVNVGDTALYWSGQGGDQQFTSCGQGADSGGFDSWVNGSSPTNYQIWIFSTDGGSVDATPTLTVNGTVYNNPVFTGGSWHFLTPFIDPSTITPGNFHTQQSPATGGAYTTFPPVTDPGTGNWKLVISHGCGGGQQNQPSISTTQLPGSGKPGDLFQDRATLSAGLNYTGAGSITFTLYSAAGCGGSVLDTETVPNITANGPYTTPHGFVIPNEGTYYWVASFSGDANNDAFTSGCNDEPVDVQRVPAAGPTVSKDASGSYTRTYGWTITKTVDQPAPLTKGGAAVTVNYSVSVSHNDGQISNVKVIGRIDVLNLDSGNETLDSITDEIRDASAAHVADCTVDTSAGLVVAPGDTIYPYSCDLGNSLPSGDVSNYVKIAWSDQNVGISQHLAAGSSDFSYPFVFSATNVNDCVSVSDSNPAGPQGQTVCVGDDNPKTFTYPVTYKDPAGTCTPHDNTAMFTTNDTGATDSASQTVTDCQGADLKVSKDATPSFTRRYEWMITKVADAHSVNTAGGADGSMGYTVYVRHDHGTDSAWTVTGSITVTNPNDWESVTLTGVSDAIDNGGNCLITSGDVHGTIAAGDSATFGYSCSYSSAPSPADFTNTATATWDADAASTPDGSADGTATGAFGDPTTILGSTATVWDPAFTGGTPPGTLGTVSYKDPSPTTFQYFAKVSGPAGTCTENDNTAHLTTGDAGADNSSAQVLDCQGADLKVSKDATPSFTRKYKWSIDKSANPTRVYTAGGANGTGHYTVNVTHDGGTDSGWLVTGTITVSNPNDWESVTLTGVSDAIDNGGNCSITSGDVHGTIAAGDSATFGYKCMYSSAPNAAAFTNTATATWDANAASTPDGSADGTKSGAFSGPTSIVDGSVAVTDPAAPAGTFTTVSYTDPSPKTFTYDGTVSGPAGKCTDNLNTATFVTNTTGTTNSASATVTDCQGADLTVTKTATGSFNRDYQWSVVKKQTTSSTPINSSASSVSVAYKVTATWSGPTDSGWQVTGTITVHNPNTWESVTLTGVTDASTGGTCSVSGDKGQTIAASGNSTGLAYTCTYASAPSPATVTDTATATWDKTAASTPDGSASGSAGVDFGTVTPTVTHNTTTVTDAFNGGAALTLGVANINGTFVKAAGNNLANWAWSYAPKTFTFTYTRSVPVVANMCKEYDNTATVTDSTPADDSSSASVVVCGPITGGLTIGWWGNNNGKAQECANDPKWRQLLDGTWTTAPYNGGSYLRSANGSLYVVPPAPANSCNTATSSFDSWMQGANSSNASYMLSAQLAGAILNVNLNGMNGNACIAGTSGPIKINTLIANVIAFLQVPANGNTTLPSPARTLAGNYQTILATLNQGQAFAVTGC
jgi:hypothetical protein